jgi:ribosomal protein L28
MATKITFKKPNLKARNVSHANNKSNRTQKLNMQTVTVNGIKLKTTAREAKTIKKYNNAA